MGTVLSKEGFEQEVSVGKEVNIEMNGQIICPEREDWKYFVKIVR